MYVSRKTFGRNLYYMSRHHNVVFDCDKQLPVLRYVSLFSVWFLALFIYWIISVNAVQFGVVVKLYTCIRKMPSSNLGLNTGDHEVSRYYPQCLHTHSRTILPLTCDDRKNLCNSSPTSYPSFDIIQSDLLRAL